MIPPRFGPANPFVSPAPAHSAASAAEMLEATGGTNVFSFDDSYAFGEGIHEMGTARMGRDPRMSVLNRYNQAHDVPNLFVTDGACMTSSACQNPSLTYIALTARSVQLGAEMDSPTRRSSPHFTTRLRP